MRPTKEDSKKPIPKGADKARQRKESLITYVRSAAQFLREAKGELKRVKWPTRKELVATTSVVIVLTFVVGFFLGIVDFGLIKVIRALVG